MKITSEWLTAAAAWAAKNEGDQSVHASRPTGARRESLVDETCVVVSFHTVLYAIDALPDGVWRPEITDLPPVITLDK
jgi:hypothetical protein